jgi:hypothetical protein
MALYYKCINPDTHHFMGMQVKVIHERDDLQTELDDWMKDPENGDVAVFNVQLAKSEAKETVLVTYSKFSKKRPRSYNNHDNDQGGYNSGRTGSTSGSRPRRDW